MKIRTEDTIGFAKAIGTIEAVISLAGLTGAATLRKFRLPILGSSLLIRGIQKLREKQEGFCDRFSTGRSLVAGTTILLSCAQMEKLIDLGKHWNTFNYFQMGVGYGVMTWICAYRLSQEEKPQKPLDTLLSISENTLKSQHYFSILSGETEKIPLGLLGNLCGSIRFFKGHAERLSKDQSGA